MTTAPFLTIQVGPRNARTDPHTGLRFYRWQGRDLPSVTSIRRMAGLPFGLHAWTVSQVINYALDNIGAIAKRLSSDDPGQLQLIRHELRTAGTAERDRAADLGTAVHDAAATGKALTEVPAEVAPRLRQYLDWLAVSGAEILGSEFQVWNLTLGYAGTCDLLCRMRDGSIWVVDLKTGKGIYSDHVLQLVDYLMAEFVGEDDKVDEELTEFLQQARGVAVLHLSDDGWEFDAFRVGPDEWAAARGLLAFATWAAGHETPETFIQARRASQEGAA